LQDNAIHVWQPDTEQDWAMDGYPTKVRELAWDRTGKVLVSGGGSFQITCWDFHGDGPAGQAPSAWTGHLEPVTALVGHVADDLIASGSRDGSVIWWRRGRPTHVALSGPAVSRLAWRGRRTAIAVGCEDGLLAVYGKT
jgi:WD40 repeat protein